jgi:hypothetical protein
LIIDVTGWPREQRLGVASRYRERLRVHARVQTSSKRESAQAPYASRK